MKERYTPNEIHPDTNQALLKHFKPEKEGRDRFGNRLFVSNDLAYLDGSKDLVRAGILISQQGDQFLKQHPGILGKLSHALAVLEESNGMNMKDQVFGLPDEGALQVVTIGGQSNVYFLTLGQEKFVIKTHVSSDRRNYRPDIHQPYINEMLQTQELAESLKDEFSRLKVKMNTFIFASGQVSCTLYEEDDKNYDALSRERLDNIKSVALGHILEQRYEGNPLWDNVDIDLPPPPKGAITALNNFRTRKDGTLVWIDPFVYYRP